MTITLDLPDELIASLRMTAQKNHVGIDDLAREGIEHAIKTATSANELPKDPNSLAKVRELLEMAGFIVPDDVEVQRLRDERIACKYGEFSIASDCGDKS